MSSRHHRSFCNSLYRGCCLCFCLVLCLGIIVHPATHYIADVVSFISKLSDIRVSSGSQTYTRELGNLTRFRLVPRAGEEESPGRDQTHYSWPQTKQQQNNNNKQTNKKQCKCRGERKLIILGELIYPSLRRNNIRSG